MFLQICHPNELIANRWKTVETIDHVEDIPQHIASPVFEWFKGLLIRVIDGEVIEYSGIFSDTACHDVGPNSDVMNNLQRRNDEEALYPSSGLSWFDVWNHCYHASWMIQSIRSFVPLPIMISVLMNLIEEESDGFPDILKWLNVVKRVSEIDVPMYRRQLGNSAGYYYDEASLRTADPTPSEIIISSLMKQSELYFALYSICLVMEGEKTSVKYVIDSLVNANSWTRWDPIDNDMDLSQHLVEVHQRRLANRLRKLIPFYDIAVALVES